MRAKKKDGHSRTIVVTEMPTAYQGISVASELEIEINYTGHGSAFRGIALDNIVIPRIIAALNDREEARSVQRYEVRFAKWPDKESMFTYALLDEHGEERHEALDAAELAEAMYGEGWCEVTNGDDTITREEYLEVKDA